MINSEEQLNKELLELLEAKEQALKYNKLGFMFPEEGLFRRELYTVHMEFMAAGDKFIERALIAGNGVGKTTCGAYEFTLHLTGLYPDWWEGRRFINPVTAWAVGFSIAETARVMQGALFGSMRDIGTGMIPKHLIVGTPRLKPGGSGAIDTAGVRHVSGGISEVTFLAGEQGRDIFQGTNINVIWLDEEQKDDGIYSECFTRLRHPVRPGIMYGTYTPLRGLSSNTMSFMPGGICPKDGLNPEAPYKYVRQVSMYDVPHLTKEFIDAAKKKYPAHELDCRIYGIPSLGSGAIYTYPVDTITCDPLPGGIPEWWPRAYGMDTKYARTAAVWGAMNPDTGQIYIYAEHVLKEALPAVHASAIKRMGDWIPGIIDNSVLEKNPGTGDTLLELYEREGLILELADKAIEAGIFAVRQGLATREILIYNTCTEILNEYRVYCRDEKGRIIKRNDDLMDAIRYLIMKFKDVATTRPDPDKYRYSSSSNSGRDPITGY